MKLRIGYDKKESTISRNLRWMRYLSGPGFEHNAGIRIRQSGPLAEVAAKARQIVQEQVYDVWSDPGNRTGDLLRSTTAKAIPTDPTVMAGWEIYMDPAKAQAKLVPEEFNYAAFFLKPDEFHTFITFQGKRGVKAAPKTFRDFFGLEGGQNTFIAFMQKYAPPRVRAAIMSEIQKRA